MDVRKEIQNIVNNNKENSEESNGDGHHNLIGHNFGIFSGALDDAKVDPITTIIDIREYDVPYVVRVCIDLNIRSGAWYTATPNTHDCGVTLSNQDIETKANPSFLAFDIECTKAPLQFPDANFDSIYMILSYIIRDPAAIIPSTFTSREERTILSASHIGVEFDYDKRAVHNGLISNIADDSDTYIYLKPSIKRENGTVDG